MGRKGLLPQDTFLYCVVNDINRPWIFTGYFCRVDGDCAIVDDTGLNIVRVSGNSVRFPLECCFFTREGAEQYIERVLKWRRQA